MTYKIALTDNELSHIGWLAYRGYFPGEAYRALALADGEPTDGEYTTRVWEIPEPAAWSILDAREDDPHGLFANTSDPLLEKLLKLESEIV